MTEFAISGNTALQGTQGDEKLYKKVVVDGKEQYVEVPIGKVTTETKLTQAAAREVQPFDETTEKEILTARKFLSNEDKKVRKGAEETLLSLYQEAFIAEGKSKKDAKKLAKLALKDDQAAIRFENRQTFVDKKEYKDAVKNDKANKDNYEYLSKKTRKFISNNQEEFYEDGKYSNEKFKGAMKEVANEDYQADLAELDLAAEEYGTTRKVMGKAAKGAGLDKETDHTAAKRFGHVLEYTAIGAATGAVIGAGVGYATGTVSNLKDSKYLSANVDDPNFDVTSEVISNSSVKVDTRKSSAKTGALAGAIAGGATGLITGLSTMKNVKDNGEGLYTKREDAVGIINDKFKKPDPIPDPVEEVECREEISEEPIIEEQPDLDYCEYTPRRGECWSDIVRAKYNLNDQKDVIAAVHKLKDYHGIKYSENVQPKVIKLYNNLEADNGKVYTLDCDKEVKGTVQRYAKQKQYDGQFNPRTSMQQTGTEYNYNRYESRNGNETLVDSQKFTDQKKLEQYILENGCN